jgi:hypothetical protein
MLQTLNSEVVGVLDRFQAEPKVLALRTPNIITSHLVSVQLGSLMLFVFRTSPENG